MFKRGSVLPFRVWTQKAILWGWELFGRQWYWSPNNSTNFWTQDYWVISFSENIFFILKAAAYYLSILTVYLLQRASYTIPQKYFWLLMCRTTNKGRWLWLSSTNVPASVVFEHSLHSYTSRLFHSVAGTNVFKILTEVPNPGITVKNNTGNDHVRKGCETKRTESGKECKELIPNKITKLRKKTHYICIYELKQSVWMLTLVGCQDNIYRKAWCVMIRLSHWEIRQYKKKKKKKRPRYFGHRMVFFLLPASPCESISIYFLIYIYII